MDILKEYRDKTYIYELLCTKTTEFYSSIKQVINIPLILSSSIMSICNSGSFNPEQMQVPNIIINAGTALLISLINNFKIVEKQQTFRNLSLKYMALLHHIEDKLNYDQDISPDDTRSIIKQYDDLIGQNEYHFPNHIKKKVRRMYYGKKKLPVILNDEVVSEPRQSRPLSEASIVYDIPINGLNTQV